MAGESTMSQSDVVVHGIKKLILDGTLAPGDQLPVEKDLAPELGVSRGSLREGVRALSIMGVLETRQGAGTYVTSLDASLLTAPMEFVVDLQHDGGARHLHAVRRVLETEAAGLAAVAMTPAQLDDAEAILGRADEAVSGAEIDHEALLEHDIAFHHVIARGSGNPVLAALIDALASRTVRGRRWRAITEVGVQAVTLAEHRAVLRAIGDRSPELARLRMAVHLFGVEEFLSDAPPDPDAQVSPSDQAGAPAQ